LLHGIYGHGQAQGRFLSTGEGGVKIPPQHTSLQQNPAESNLKSSDQAVSLDVLCSVRTITTYIYI